MLLRYSRNQIFIFIGNFFFYYSECCQNQLETIFEIISFNIVQKRFCQIAKDFDIAIIVL